MTATAPDLLPALFGEDAERLRRTLGRIGADAARRPPAWLRADQVVPFRRAVIALERHGAALLALPVGTGKSFIAAAAALALGHRAIAVVGPTLLRPQWQALGARLGVEVSFTSLDLLSRGRGAPGPGFIIIDESHRLCQPHTRRYRTLAPTLVGRMVLLLSATPIVNRAADLAAQLALGLRDDALAAAGLPSIAEGLSGPALPPAIAAVVIGGDPPDDLPGQRVVTIPDWGLADPRLDCVLELIDRLRLSTDRPIGTLIRTSLLRAAASGPAALLESVRRYRRLLDHATRARRAGHPVNRAAIRGVIGAAPDQLVMWELLDPVRITGDLALGDRRLLERLDALVVRWQVDGDAKRARLAAVLADRWVSVVFCSSVATVHHLRRALGSGTAWLTGGGAGVGSLRLPRSQVTGWFGPDRAHGPGLPWLLIASDVAAEGLNLQGAARVVHFDLPWTAVRLDQRVGRVVRLGSRHLLAEVVRFAVPAAVEQRLGLEAAVETKRRVGASLLDRVGGVAGAEGMAISGWAQYSSREPGEGFVASVRFHRGEQPAGEWLVSFREQAGWSDDREVVRGLIDRLGDPIEAIDDLLSPVLDLLEGAIAERIRRLNGSLLGQRGRSAGRIGTSAGFISARVQGVAIFKPPPVPATLPV